MLLNTKHFGEIEISEDRCISFEKGLPGFEDLHSYIIIEGSEADSPFKWLQCVDDPKLIFAIVNPFEIKPDYDFEIKSDIIEELNINSEKDIVIYAIANIPDDLAKASINLKAPLVIDANSRHGMQIILDTDKYNVRHYILDEIRKQGVARNACTDEEKGPIACY